MVFPLLVGGAFPHPMKPILRHFLIKAIREIEWFRLVAQKDKACFWKQRMGL
jgi:hypothetical protein